MESYVSKLVQFCCADLWCCVLPKAAFNLDYYTEVLDLQYLLEHLSEDPFFHKYKKLNEALVGLVEDYSLVSFIPLDIQVAYKQDTK